MIDITENSKQIKELSEADFFDSLGPAAKMRTGFAACGALVGFGIAVKKRQPWLAFTATGFVVGGLIGWGTSALFYNDNN